jgi:hypothetical protein
MKILCRVTREQFETADNLGRPYTMELVHYDDHATGERLFTKGYIVPTNTVEVTDNIGITTRADSPPREQTTGIATRAAQIARRVIRQFF